VKGLKNLQQHRWVKTVVGVSAILLFCYLSFFNHIEPSQVGIARNWITGKIWLQEAGWHLGPPWAWTARIDTRPMRVSVDSAGHGFSGKLVQFDPAYWEEFVQVEGWRYYWWANRFSFNWGYNEEHRGIRDILRGHAYGVKKYPFIKVLEEYEHEM
jgi:hypothetical protein